MCIFSVSDSIDFFFYQIGVVAGCGDVYYQIKTRNILPIYILLLLYGKSVIIAGRFMLVSVYMPTKNRLSLLQKAVESVLGQSLGMLELIVVNDGSTDATRDYLASVASRDARLRAIHHDTSRGPQACRNAAIAAATGEYVTGIDDDDSFHPNRLEIFVNQWSMLDKVGVRRAFLYSQDELWSNGSVYGYTSKMGSVVEKDLLIKNQVGNQIFAPRQTFLSAGRFDETLPAWQDLEMFIRILKNNKVGCLVDAPTYLFDISPRPDRISAQGPRIRQAFEKIAATRSDARERQQLMLQMFAPHYGLRPSLEEVRTFIGMGRWPEGTLTMIRRYFGKY